MALRSYWKDPENLYQGHYSRISPKAFSGRLISGKCKGLGCLAKYVSNWWRNCSSSIYQVFRCLSRCWFLNLYGNHIIQESPSYYSDYIVSRLENARIFAETLVVEFGYLKAYIVDIYKPRNLKIIAPNNIDQNMRLPELGDYKLVSPFVLDFYHSKTKVSRQS